MGTYYIIVPKDDGYHYLSINERNEYEILAKSDTPIKTKLLFREHNAAEDYILNNLDWSMYRIERVLLSAEYFGL